MEFFTMVRTHVAWGLAALVLGATSACSSEYSDGFSRTLDAEPSTASGGADGGLGGNGDAGGSGGGKLDSGLTGQLDGGADGNGGEGHDAGLTSMDAATERPDGGSPSLDAGGENPDSGNPSLDAGSESHDGGSTHAGGGTDAGLVSVADAGPGEPRDAGPGTEIHDDGGVHCDFGSAQSQATAGTLDLFGEIVYFADGLEFPPGTYRVVYEDGCMKYASSQAWTIHAYGNAGFDHRWWIVGETTSDRKVKTPGTTGIFVGAGGYETFAECVAANLSLSVPVTFEHSGGKLGVWLHDSNYPDNVAGEDGRNPRYRLERLGSCHPEPAPIE
jgi:hypothetical protein